MDSEENSEETNEGLVHSWQGFQDVSPCLNPALQGIPVFKVAIGGHHCTFLTQHHLVLTSGDNRYGQLGLDHIGGQGDVPMLVESLKDVMIVDVACGSRHTAAVTSLGDVYCWGDSSVGQCGTGETQTYPSPQMIRICDTPKSSSCSHISSETDDIVNVEQISCGENHTVVVSDIGELWTWGSGIGLGVNRNENTLKPERVQYLEGRRVLSVACGAQHTLALVQKLGKSGMVRQGSSIEGCRRSKSRSQSPTVNNVQLHRNRPSTCVKCQEEIYTYVETNDTCIISDKHTCPLGLAVNSEKGKTLGHGDLQVRSGMGKQGNSDKLENSNSESSSVKTSPGHSSLESIQEESNVKSSQAKNFHQSNDVSVYDSSDRDSVNLKPPNCDNIQDNENPEIRKTSPSHVQGTRSKSVSPVPPLTIPPEISSLEETQLQDKTTSQANHSDVSIDSIKPSAKGLSNNINGCELLQNGAASAKETSEHGEHIQTNEVEGNTSGEITTDQTAAESTDGKPDDIYVREHQSGSVSSLGSLQKSRSSFLNESEAKSFLEKTLAGEDDFEPTSKNKTDEDTPSSPFVKHVENILQYVPSSPAQVQEYVTTLTKSVVSNIKTSIDKFTFVSAQNNVELDTLSKSSSQDSLANVGQESPTSRRRLESRLGQVRDAEEVMFPSSLPLFSSNTIPRSTSLGGIHRASHNAERKGSLPIAALCLSKKTSCLPGQPEVILDTEVWSWGQGRKGQLGHGDMLDRPSPCCAKFLSDKRVVKLAAGAYHSLALTADSTVYTMGLNNHGQLGHTDDAGCASPHKIRTLSDTPIWDVGAGDAHSIVIADGAGFTPDVYYTGKHPSDDSQAGFTSQLTRIGALRKVGWIRQLAAGNQICMCLSDRNITGHIATIHEFAATERGFHQQLNKVNSVILQPLTATDALRAVETTTYGTVNKLLVDAFLHVSDVVAINSLELTHVLQRTLDLDSLQLLANSQQCVATFQNYSKCFGDALALGAFDFIIRTASPFFEKNKDKLNDLLESGQTDKSNHALNLRRLLQTPLLRLKDYNKLINKLALKYPPYTSEYHQMASCGQAWDTLKTDASREHKQADNTKKFWEMCPTKFAEALRIPGRRLIRESKGNPISLPSSGRFSMHWLILFSDVFVHGQYSMHQTFPLSTIWVEAVPDTEALKNGIILTMPEEILTLTAHGPSEKAEWLWAINQAIDRVLTDQKNLVRPVVPGGRLTPPLARQATHVFYKNPAMKDAKYVGMWLSGKMHGQSEAIYVFSGELQWPDGRKYVGKFKQGQQCGHGVFTLTKDGREEVYDGYWKEGKMNGLGTVKYANGDVYEGYFKDGKKHGHGVLRQGRFTSGSSLASIYVGEWCTDKKSGYGVFDDVSKGQKYMGLWQDDCRHGNGIIVTLDGMYFEGNFTQNKMTGLGLLMTDDNSSYEGEFSGGPNLYGKGTLTLPNGDYIEGHFNGSFIEGIKVSGTFYKAVEPVTERRGFTHALGLIPKTFGELSVPADRKWIDVFQHCRSLFGCHDNKMVETSKAWEAVAVMVSAGKKSLKEDGKRASTPMGCLDELEKIPPYCHGHLYYEDYIHVKAYLAKAFDTAFHPLGKLMEGLVDVYRATYVGVGAHPRLLYHAVHEVKSYVARVYSLVRLLFPALPMQEGPVQIFTRRGETLLQQGLDEEEEPSAVVSPGELLHPLLLPRLYPPLFTLYALYNEREDERYWKRVLMWNKQADMALMAYLGMDQLFWLLDESVITDGRMRLSNVRDQCYREAIETLQHISTAFSPAEKLQLIQKTFDEINKAVQTAVGSGHLWCMDDLFPVFLYVVVRARIRHLGAEIHLVDDLMEPHLQHGELGIMFTTLKACYFQIQNEKMQ